MSEHDEQVAVIEWARYNKGIHPCLEWLHAIPNGANLAGNASRRAAQMNKLKAEGLVPGISDLFLPWPSRGFHGFYIEMKRPGNINGVRDGQKDFIAFVESAGYFAQVHDNAESAIEALKWYLGSD